MKLPFRLTAAAIALVIATPSVSVAHDRGHHDNHRHDDRNDGAAVAAVIGVAIVAAAAASAAKKKREDQYYRGDRDYDDRDWGSTYRPARDTVCYRDSRQCFWRDRFSMEWTQREFGAYPYRRGY